MNLDNKSVLNCDDYSNSVRYNPLNYLYDREGKIDNDKVMCLVDMITTLMD